MGNDVISILKPGNRLIIEYSQISLSRLYRQKALLSLILSTIPLLISIFIGELFFGFLFVLLVSLTYTIPYLIFYIYEMAVRYEWNFDKSASVILLKKGILQKKQSKIFKFNQIKRLVVREHSRFINDPIYILSFKMEGNRGYKIYTGDEKVCSQIGWNIARFMNKYCEYKK